MNSKQLFYALHHNKVTEPFFDGIYARNTLVQIQAPPQLVVCNTDRLGSPGIHWILFHFKGDHLIFYDSLGHPFSHYGDEIILFVQRWATSFECVTKRTQPSKTNLCGMYCLYFAYYSCQNWKTDRIVKSMTSSHKVLNVVSRIFTICTFFACPFLQCCVTL